MPWQQSFPRPAASLVRLDPFGATPFEGWQNDDAQFREVGPPVTIVGGAITITGSWHSVDTEAAAATDDLTYIYGGYVGQVLVLQTFATTRDVSLKSQWSAGTGNMSLRNGSSFELNNVNDMIVLMNTGWDPGRRIFMWQEVARSKNVAIITADPADPFYGDLWFRADVGSQGKWKGKRLSDTPYLGIQGEILMGDGNELTIATGVITVTQSYHKVDTQADAASDDLDTINGGVTGMQLVLQAINDARDVVVKDGTGNIQLDGGVDMTLNNTLDTITLIYNGSAWCELSRSDNGA